MEQREYYLNIKNRAYTSCQVLLIIVILQYWPDQEKKVKSKAHNSIYIPEVSIKCLPNNSLEAPIKYTHSLKLIVSTFSRYIYIYTLRRL
jgi:hypothetical protein